MSFNGEFAAAAKENPNGLAVGLLIGLNEATWDPGDGVLTANFGVSDKADSALGFGFEPIVVKGGWGGGLRQTIELRAAGLSGYTLSVEVADPDYRVRDMLTNGNNRNSIATVQRVVPGSLDDYDLRFVGLLDSWEFSRGKVKLNFKTDERNLKANFPAWRYLKSEWFGMDPEFDRTPAPHVYGKHDSTSLNLEHGMVPTTPVWMANGWWATNLAPATLIKDVYVTDSSTTVKLAHSGTYGDPGNSYEKVYGSLAGAKIFSIIEWRRDVAALPSTDSVITADLYGYSLESETPYDESNTMTNPVAQIRHFLINFAVLRSNGYLGGTFWTNTDALIEPVSWDAAITWATNRGLEGSRFMNEPKTALAWFTEWCESFPAFRPFWSTEGSIEMALLTTDWPGYWDGATEIISREDTIGKEFVYTLDPMDITSKITIQYCRDSVQNKFLRTLDVQDPTTGELSDTTLSMYWAPSRQA